MSTVCGRAQVHDRSYIIPLVKKYLSTLAPTTYFSCQYIGKLGKFTSASLGPPQISNRILETAARLSNVHPDTRHRGDFSIFNMNVSGSLMLYSYRLDRYGQRNSVFAGFGPGPIDTGAPAGPPSQAGSVSGSYVSASQTSAYGQNR